MDNVMDIEKTRKINLMAKELQKHGFAEYSDGAAALASQMYGVEVPGAGPEDQFAAFEKRTEQRIDTAVRGMNSSNAELKRELVKLWETVGRMNTHILNLSNAAASNAAAKNDAKIYGLKSAGGSSEDAPEEIVVEEELKHEEREEAKPRLREIEPAQNAQKKPESRSETVGRNRTGDYSSKDVSIEKFFYFGNKPR